MRCYRTYIPTALSRREAERLAWYAAGRTVVEAGALLGFSTIALAETADRVYSIDRHMGYYGTKFSERPFRRNLEVCNVAGKVTPVISDAEQVRKYPAAFAFIDLDGTCETTLRVLRCVYAPLVGIHDFARLNCRGVEEAIRLSGLPVIERVDSLIVIRKPL